jgi:parallel beta helix pectate lyase-like protein
MIKNARFPLAALLVAILPVCASAQSQRTFVSAGSGIDANPCDRALPCRNFAAAAAVTQAGGEVVVLDSGGYGSFAINQAISIEAPSGVLAGISVPGGTTNGIDVNAGSGEVVILRGLTINGVGGNTGIRIGSGKVILIERCSINRMISSGIAAIGVATVMVKDTTVIGSFIGIQTGSGLDPVRGLIEHCRIQQNGNREGNGLAVVAYDPSSTTIRDSVLTGAGSDLGASVEGADGHSELNVENCSVSGFGIALYAAAVVSRGGSAVMRVSNSMITFNGTGVSTTDSVNAPILTRGTNTLEGNTVNGAFTATFAPQ